MLYYHAGRIPSPTTSSVDLDDDGLDADNDSVESSSKMIKISVVTYRQYNNVSSKEGTAKWLSKHVKLV